MHATHIHTPPPTHTRTYTHTAHTHTHTHTHSTQIYMHTHLYLLQGIKMGSRILVNGQQIGTTTDQFLRYVFPLKSPSIHTGVFDGYSHTHPTHPHTLFLITSGWNTIEVVFDAYDPIATLGRFMSCTGGWDWVCMHVCVCVCVCLYV